MKEVEVVKRTFDYLNDELEYQLWIDNHPAYSTLPFDQYPRHSITIRGYIPDIIGFTPLGYIVTIEAKGEKDIQKGMGQALVYKLGSDLVYLAAESEKMEIVQNILLHNQIGAIKVSEKNVELIEPISQYTAFFRDDTKRELEFLKKKVMVSHKRLTDLTRNHIINYLAPVVVIGSEYESADTILEKLESYHVKATKELVKGAKIIGLIKEKEGKIRLTDEGFLIKTLLKFKNLCSFDGLQEIIDRTSRKKGVALITEYPDIAISLKMLYTRNELFVELLDVFEKYGKNELSFKELIKDIILNKPNLFLNMFCKREKREEVLKLMQKGKEREIYQSTEMLNQYIVYSSVFTFKKHLIHLGILSPELKLFSGKLKEYDPETDIWKILKV